ncbi:polymorphic toxin type 44 domain-containing protein [Actinopolyspora sp. H202]|uniref:polymorphic toxin type 44 domain-containing protein n=1 Tax=Actinopolyspora sp. H202 TaxID=1500456 RepID=UPI003EE69106
MLKAVHSSGWTGEDAAAAVGFIDKTTQEFEDAVSEAVGIRDILDEALQVFESKRERLQEITDEVAPRHDFDAPEQASLAAAEAAQSEARFNKAEDFIYDEMMRNIESDSVRNIKQLLSDPEWYEFWRRPGQEATTALAMWAGKVAPGQEWDHKPIMAEKFNLESQKEFDFKVPGQDRSVSYDIWSNIHYGYVGRAAGIDSETLITGASIGEVVGQDDVGDQATMRAGIELYEKYGDSLTKDQLRQKVMETVDEMQNNDAPQVKDWKSRNY